MVLLHKAKSTEGIDVKGYLTKIKGTYHIISDTDESIVYYADANTIETCFDMDYGKLVVLPCKIGDTLYLVRDYNRKEKFIVKSTVCSTQLVDDDFGFSLKFDIPCRYCNYCANDGDYYNEHEQDLINGYCTWTWGTNGRTSPFGETVFFTLEEAENSVELTRSIN